MKLLAVVLATSLATCASAETCKYVDAQGNITYSNVPIAGATLVNCLGSPGPVPHAAIQRAAEDKKDSTDRPAPPPRDNRRSELQLKLANEQAKLSEAQRQLADQEAQRNGDERNYQRVLERVKPYQEAVEQLQRSVDTLQKELAGAN